jgi:hypothetical protein
VTTAAAHSTQAGSLAYTGFGRGIWTTGAAGVLILGLGVVAVGAASLSEQRRRHGRRADLPPSRSG